MRLAILTTGRQDWGLLRPLCAALRDDDRFDLVLLVGGMALRPEFGNTVESIRSLGFRVDAELDFDVTRKNAAAQAATAVELVAGVLRETHPDALVLLGDRFETAGAALAATLVSVPVIHLYGGEETEGAFDNSLRHSITKLSHLHLVSHAEHARRVRQMGENPEAIHVVGHLSFDNLTLESLPTRADIEDELGIELSPPVCLVTVHPSTLSDPSDENEADAVSAAINEIKATWVVTLPNADPGNEYIRRKFSFLAEGMENVVAVEALGESKYFGLLRLCDVVLGNSSSGFTEAPAFGVPTVNVGDRQKGRVRSESIVDVPSCSASVVSEVRRALLANSRRRETERSLFSIKHSIAQKILAILADFVPPNPPRKRFHDLAT